MSIEEKPSQAPVYRNRQTILGLLVRPRQQMRLANYYIVGTWVSHIAILAILVPYVGELSQIEMALVILGSATVLSIFAFVVGVILSHRLYGPLISIKRHIASLREGQYSARLQLRANDDLSELKDSLNDLAVALEGRHGPGKRTPS